MITFAVESLTERLEEMKPFFPLHYEELALDKDHVPLDPQYGIYLERDRRGEVLLVTARAAGEMCGYFVGFIAPGLHYKTCLTCTSDIYWMAPAYRGLNHGRELFTFVFNELRRRGVQRVFLGTKSHASVSRLFESLGAPEVERYHSLWLGS
jgi:GNAT superfamily N-acetyltransferase